MVLPKYPARNFVAVEQLLVITVCCRLARLEMHSHPRQPGERGRLILKP